MRCPSSDSSGNCLLSWGSYGTKVGEFDNPAGIAIDDSGKVFVADRDNQRVQIFFDPSGNLLTKWGTLGNGNGQFGLPQDVALDHFGDVYVADTNNTCIQQFTFKD